MYKFYEGKVSQIMNKYKNNLVEDSQRFFSSTQQSDVHVYDACNICTRKKHDCKLKFQT
jgi:hypothetical protein